MIQKDLSTQVRGDTWSFSFTIQDYTGAAENITSYEYWFTLKSNPDDTDANAVLQEGPIIISAQNGVIGKVYIEIPASQTFYIAPKTYYYDLQEVTPAGVVSTLLLGKIKVIKDVTLTADYIGAPGGNSAYPVILVESSSYTVLATDYYIGVDYNGQVAITLPNSSLAGRELIIKDESGFANINNISLIGTVDNDSGGAILAIPNGSLHLLYRNGWRIV